MFLTDEATALSWTVEHVWVPVLDISRFCSRPDQMILEILSVLCIRAIFYVDITLIVFQICVSARPICRLVIFV